MIRFPLILVFISVYLMLSAQTDTSVFSVMKKVETTEYTFFVPEKWKNITPVDISTKDKKFEFTGIGLPHTMNDAPVTAFFTLKKYECPAMLNAEDYVLSELTSYPDRVTPPGKNYEKDTLVITSGETGVLYSSNYFRRNKSSNFTRYELIVYSQKRKAAYMLSASFQYKDSTYMAASDWKSRDYALRVFKTLLLR